MTDRNVCATLIKMNIYISTIAFRGQPVEAAIQACEQEGWAMEFSSGLPHRADMKKVYKSCLLTRMPHNYFPAPKVPFVLNLASSNEAIRRISIEHCKLGLQLSAQADAPFYAAHAGFCIDPDPAELGQKIRVKRPYDRAVHWNLFLKSVEEILKTAEELDMDFLIENNVIISLNVEGGRQPLLCTNAEEMAQLMTDIQHPRLGILLDTAHLKVSAQTQHFSLADTMSRLRPYIKGIHHSDNDGLFDTNEKITKGYWFFDYLNNYRELVHVLEVKALSIEEIHQQIALLRDHADNYRH